ncbi:MAG: hypothetical protein ACFBSG_10715 [Leptolyngbyaceae cyanobacterium]
MNRPWTFQILLPLVVIVLLAVSCERILRNLQGNPEISQSQPSDTSAESETVVGNQTLDTFDEGQVLQNETAGIAITLPGSWSADSQLHNSAELQASDPDKQLYLIVVAEDADKLMRLGLKENAANYREMLRQRMTAYESESATEVAFIDGDFATQYEVRGRVDENTPVVYLHTTVVSEDRYYQIVAWTTPEQYAEYRSELRGIAETFREIES